MSTFCPILYLRYIKQALLVAGGYNDDDYDYDYDYDLSSTELFSNGKWTTGGNLPR